jgi:hypothetical protein
LILRRTRWLALLDGEQKQIKRPGSPPGLSLSAPAAPFSEIIEPALHPQSAHKLACATTLASPL